MKQNKGITLVALIITIIVLLILAVVAISAVQGDGIIAHAKNARDEYQTAQNDENTALGNYLTYLDNANGEGENNGGSSTIILKSYSDSSRDASKDGEGYLTENATYTDEENKTATVPSGFKVSETDGEQTISTGLVVKDSAGNEFVWVPVSNISEMAQLQSGSETNYQGVLYNFTSDGATTKGTLGTDYGIGTTSRREPDTISDYDGNTTYLSTVGCNTIEEFKTQMQTEFNSMVASVSKYKGFYVARYELSTTSEGKLASKAGATVTTAATNSNRWYGLYNICKTYNVTNSVESNMIYGCQYDAMLRWMQSAGIDVTSTSITGVSYNTNSSTTGQSGDTDKLNNVYDLLGGHFEFTQEAISTTGRVTRGGYGEMSILWYEASRRGSELMVNIQFQCSARATLYIK